MNDSDSPMPISRQLRYQKQCRENWKENAAKKQEKIREYVQANRALTKSRDSWKARAKFAEQRVKELEKQLKIFGLNPASIPSFLYRLSHRKIPQFLQPFQQQILTCLQEQIPPSLDRTLLATSDVLESIFSRYKYFSQRSPISELRSLLLTIPLSTINFTNQFVKGALMTVRSADLAHWVQHTFGQSNLLKRKLLFGH